MGVAPKRQAHALTVSELGQIVDEWLAVRPAEPGALFTRVFYCNHPTTERIGPRAISRTVQERAIAAGFDGLPVSGHSLRAGHATTAAVSPVAAHSPSPRGR